MGNKRKWYSILLVGLVLLLTTPFVGCGSVDEEAIEYLGKMRDWQDKWKETRIGGDLDELDGLVDELEAIEMLRDPIPLTLYGHTGDYWTFSDHEEYLRACRLWLAVKAHMNRMQELEEARYRAMGSDEIPSCDVAMEYGEGSPEYKDACLLLDQANRNLSWMEAILSIFFAVYLPERN
jgi:hypothetical protein